MEALTVEERLLLAWYKTLNENERAIIDGWTRALHTAASGMSPPPSADILLSADIVLSADILHLLRRDLQQLLKIAASQGSD